MVTTRSASQALNSSPAAANGHTPTTPAVGTEIEVETGILPLRTRERGQSQSQTPSPSRKRKSAPSIRVESAKKRAKAQHDEPLDFQEAEVERNIDSNVLPETGVAVQPAETTGTQSPAGGEAAKLSTTTVDASALPTEQEPHELRSIPPEDGGSLLGQVLVLEERAGGQDDGKDAAALGDVEQGLLAQHDTAEQKAEQENALADSALDIPFEKRVQLSDPEVLPPPTARPQNTHIRFDDAEPGEANVEVLEDSSFLTAETSKAEQMSEEDADDHDDDAPESFNLKGPGLGAGGLALSNAGKGKKKKEKKRKADAVIEATLSAEGVEIIGEEPMIPELNAIPESESMPPEDLTQSDKIGQDAQDINTMSNSKKRRHSSPLFQRPLKKSQDVVRDGTTKRTILEEPASSREGVASLPPKCSASLSLSRNGGQRSGGRLGLLRPRKMRTVWAGRSGFLAGVKT